MVYTSIALKGTHTTLLPHHDPASTPVDHTTGSAFVDPNIVHLFLNPYTSQNLQVNPQVAQNLLPETSAVQNLIVNPNAAPNLVVDPSTIQRDDGASPLDYQGRTSQYGTGEPDRRPSALAQREPAPPHEGHQLIQGEDPGSAYRVC